MSIKDTWKGKQALFLLAVQEGKTLAEIEADIQEAIDAAWDSPDPATRETQRAMFPDGKPTPAQFVGRVAKEIRKEIH